MKSLNDPLLYSREGAAAATATAAPDSSSGKNSPHVTQKRSPAALA
jgi:hypothetical protein